MLLFALVLTVNVGRSIKMDTLENEINRSVIDVDRNQECLEHEVSICNLEKRLCKLKEYVNAMGQHLNGAIERINSLHQALKELANDLEYDEATSTCDEELG